MAEPLIPDSGPDPDRGAGSVDPSQGGPARYNPADPELVETRKLARSSVPLPPRMVSAAFWLYLAVAFVYAIILAVGGVSTTASSLVLATVAVLVLVAVPVVGAIFLRRGAGWSRWLLSAYSMILLVLAFGTSVVIYVVTAAAVLAAVLVWLRSSRQYVRHVADRVRAIRTIRDYSAEPESPTE